MTKASESFEIIGLALAFGFAGAALAGWLVSRRLLAQLSAQREAMEAALAAHRQAQQRQIDRLLAQQRRWLSGSESPSATGPTGQRAETSSTSMARSRNWAGSPVPLPQSADEPVRMADAEPAARELTDEEIDALPPDLPMPMRPAPKRQRPTGKPVLRKI